MNNIKYLISVIIPVYNAENTIELAINSVINQSIGFSNIELIIVDDKSKDNTKSIIEEYQNKFNNIIGVFLENNSGLPGKPRSIGIDYATSDYIIFLDADDQYSNDAFEILYNTILEQNSDFVIGNHYFNFDGKKIESKFKFKTNNHNLININPQKNQESFDKLSHDHIAPWGKIFKKELILKNNIKFPYDALCEDTYFYFKALINSNKITVLPNSFIYLYNTFESNESAIHGHNLNKFNYFLKGINNLDNLLKDFKFSPIITISNNIGYLLLIFSNINKTDKKRVINKIYKLETNLNSDFQIIKKEINILNILILKKHFSLAIYLSEFYKFLYNNKMIKEYYRRINNKRID